MGFSVSGRVLTGAVAIGVALSIDAPVGRGHGMEEHIGRNVDARVALASSPAMLAQTDGRQQQDLEVLRTAIPELAVTFDPITGVTRTLMNRVGYLTEPDDRGPQAIAEAYIDESLARLGLEAADVADRELTDLVYSKVTGATHVYYRQRIHGLSVYNAQLQINVNRDGRVLSLNNGFMPGVASAPNALQPTLGADAAVRHAAAHLGIANATVRVAGSADDRPHRETRLEAQGVSREPLNARLMLLPVRKGEARLVWNFQIHTIDGTHAYDFTVDAHSAQIWTRFDWAARDRYKVYAMPAESPNHAVPVPPDDGRSILVNPHDPVASPFGWHDTDGRPGAEFATMRGNNVHAYDAAGGSTAPPATEPACGANLECVFPIYLSHEAFTYRPAALANLFYWNNLVHDVQYAYGFDEAAGNFQMNNYGRGGAGSDAVVAEAVADHPIFLMPTSTFSTPPDGQQPRMQVFLYFDRERALDNGIIVHEYGHGIANRQVGGPSNVNCLSNAQQPGEGLSDWWALVYTATPADTGPQPRGIGTYALGHPRTGPGLRLRRYSTDPGINDWTYESIAGRDPYVVGAVWAQAMWRVYWTLVDRHGFSASLQNPAGGAGNQRAMLYVNEGLKNTPCSPTFTDVRDAIIQAAVDNYAGADVCRMWDSFASFGLGVDAISGGPDSTAVTNGFRRPDACVNPLPDEAELLAPLGHIGTRTPAYTWRAVPSSAWYQLVGGDSAGSVFERWYTPAAVGCTAALTCAATPGVTLHDGLAWWRVRTGSSAGSGPWSVTGDFFIGPPAAPVVTAPLGTIATTSVTFVWTAAPTATWYQLWVNDATGNRVRQWYTAAAAGCAAGTGTCQIAPSVSLAPGEGQFWVQGWNDVGYGPWSSPGNYSIGVPLAPAPIAPDGTVTSTMPAYVWSAMPAATWYRLWVDDSAGNRLQQWYGGAEAGCAAGTGICQVRPSVSLNSGAAQFWVQAWNSFGATAWSRGLTFTVAADAPVSVVETWPVSGGMPGKPVRLWARVRNDSGAALPDGYRLWFETTSPGNAVAWAGEQSIADLAAGESRWYFFDWLAGPDAAGYEYRAQVWDGSNERSMPSAPRQFSLGFLSQFYKTTDRWQGTSGSWYLPSQGLVRQLYGYGLVDDDVNVNAAYGTTVNTFQTLDYSVTMRRNGCATCATRVIVRGTVGPQDAVQQWRSWYAFQYATNGTYSVYKRVNGVTTVLQEWTASPSVSQGSSWNALRVVAHRSRLWFYINGALVWTGTDDDLSGGQVGVGLWSETRYDSLTITQPSLQDPALPDEAALAVPDRISAEQLQLNEAARNAPSAGDVNRAPSAARSPLSPR